MWLVCVFCACVYLIVLLCLCLICLLSCLVVCSLCVFVAVLIVVVVWVCFCTPPLHNSWIYICCCVCAFAAPIEQRISVVKTYANFNCFAEHLIKL